MKTIVETLISNMTIANTAKAKVNSEAIGADAYASFIFAEKVAYEALYRYASARKSTAFGGENAVVNADIVSNAMKAIDMILDCIGEVKGHKIAKNIAMLDTLADCVYADKKELTGEAFTQKSIVDNFRKQLREGGNAEYIAKVEADLEVAKIKLAELKKQENSGKAYTTRVSFNAFRGKVELALGLIVAEQNAKTWEELEAEAEARRKERRAKTKAKKAEKK